MRDTPDRLFVAFLCVLLPIPTWAALPPPTAPPREPGRHALYVEGMGKGGVYGVGYDYQILPRLAVGGALSYAPLSGEHVVAIAPYVGANLVGVRRHRLYAHLGPIVVHSRTPSPVPEWPGTSATGVSAALATGYEYRDRLLFRVCAMGTVGKGGFAPWAGVSLGWAR